jgi:ATP-dependent DNA helicase RecQ
MTRARKTLAVTATGEHRFLKTGGDGVLRRRVSVELGSEEPRRIRYELPDLETVDLSFAGRLGHGHHTHHAIASAQVGDELDLVQEGERWILHDRQGRPVGRMAKAWRPPVNMVFLSGAVGAVVRWRKIDNDERYRDRIKRDEWETVLPELRFANDVR